MKSVSTSVSNFIKPVQHNDFVKLGLVKVIELNLEL